MSTPSWRPMARRQNERRSETFRRLWDYPDAGMTVEFGPDGRTVAAVEYHALGAAAKGGRREPPPIVEARPPLHDIARHQANIQLALSQTGRSFNWVSSSEE